MSGRSPVVLSTKCAIAAACQSPALFWEDAAKPPVVSESAWRSPLRMPPFQMPPTAVT